MLLLDSDVLVSDPVDHPCVSLTAVGMATATHTGSDDLLGGKSGYDTRDLFRQTVMMQSRPMADSRGHNQVGCYGEGMNLDVSKRRSGAGVDSTLQSREPSIANHDHEQIGDIPLRNPGTHCYSLGLGSSEYSQALLRERLEEENAMRPAPSWFSCLSHAITSIIKDTAKQTEYQVNAGHFTIQGHPYYNLSCIDLLTTS